MNPIKHICSHIYYWSEQYIIFPLVIVSIIGSLALVNHYQQAVFDLGSIIDLSLVQLKAILILMNTAFTLQATQLWFNKINDGKLVEFREKVLNLCASVIFFAGYCYLFR